MNKTPKGDREPTNSEVEAPSLLEDVVADENVRPRERRSWTWILNIIMMIGTFSGIAFFFYDQYKAKKELDISIISQESLISTTLDTDFLLTYKGEPAKNIASILLRVRNTGRQPIEPKDFDGDIRIAFSGINRIVSVKPGSSQPPDLQFRIRTDQNVLAISPVLLNSGDMGVIAITALCDKASDIEVDIASARISGINSITIDQDFKVSVNDTVDMSWFFILALIINAFLTSYMVIKSDNRLRHNRDLFLSFLSLVFQHERETDPARLAEYRAEIGDISKQLLLGDQKEK